MRKRLAVTALAGAVWLMAGSRTAQAQLSLIYDADTKTAKAGDAVIFQGTVTNTGTSSLFINDGSGSFSPGVLDDTGFFNNFLGVQLSPGASKTAEMFRATLDSNTANGEYSGLYQIDSGPNFGSSVYSVNRVFTVRVQAVPELSLNAMLSGGMIFIFARRLQRRREGGNSRCNA